MFLEDHPMKTTRFAVCGAALACLLALGACTPSGDSAAPAREDTAQSSAAKSGSENAGSGVLSNFSTTDLDGNTIDQSILCLLYTSPSPRD